jgi:pimeloyl-ACP methyl ester carboxylesterase
MPDLKNDVLPYFEERRVNRGLGSVYVRDFPGTGPAFVVLHGFPDTSHIYDAVIPYLSAAGRRVVAVDFLGFGGSDKPANANYSFVQQLGDLEAVAEALELDKIIPVGHDAGGPAAINFALKHPSRTAFVILMNVFYGDVQGLRVPEIIEVFSNKKLEALHHHFLQSPQQFAWLLEFQRARLGTILKESQRARYREFLGPIIDQNFMQQPSAAPAFAQMAYQLTDEVAANTARLSELRRSDVPLLLIWGKADPYLHVGVAEDLRSQARRASLHVLEAGHWPQIDEAAETARIMLETRW